MPAKITLTERIDALASTVATLAGVVAALAPAQGAPVAIPAESTVVVAERTWATKAERKAGNGFSCSCGRKDLRKAPVSGSYHNRPNGKKHTIA